MQICGFVATVRTIFDSTRTALTPELGMLELVTCTASTHVPFLRPYLLPSGLDEQYIRDVFRWGLVAATKDRKDALAPLGIPVI